MKDAARGARFAAARGRTGLSQRGLADKLGNTNQAVSAWEKGNSVPRHDMVVKISELSGYSVEWLLTGVERSAGEQSNVVDRIGKGRPVPKLGDTNSGPVSSRNKSVEYVQSHFPCSARSYALQVVGDSMVPAFHEGDIVVIDPDIDPLPGDFVLAEVHGTRMFRRYRPQTMAHGKTPAVFDLVPSNPDWPTVRIDSTNPGKVLGVMSEHFAPRRRQS